MFAEDINASFWLDMTADAHAPNEIGKPTKAVMVTRNVVQSTVSDVKDAAELWCIHGKYYDLEHFMDKHPGGVDFLERAKGLHDCTPLFESYHAMSFKRPQIESIMAKYRIDDAAAASKGLKPAPSSYLFEKGGFYLTCRDRVQAAFPNLGATKANRLWYVKCTLLFAAYLITFGLAFSFTRVLPLWGRVAMAAAAGVLIHTINFCVMHDASHLSLFEHRPRLTEYISRACLGAILWGHTRWIQHHVIRHHSFTGDPMYDPDIVHLEPMIFKNESRKHRSDRRGKKATTKKESKPWLSMKARTIIFTWIFPGLWLGQAFSYHVTWPVLGKCFRMNMVYDTRFRDGMVDLAFKVAVVGTIALNFNIWTTIAYVVANNVTYACLILADHDTIETHNNSHKGTRDWGEIQVRHSGDFGQKYPWVQFFFGGINYQIEHHLFPSINHVHYPTIAPIVRQCCTEFNIPFVAYDGVWEAYLACIETFEAVESSRELD